MCCRFKISSKGAIPQYFYMPITQAAKEPDFGLAPLKKRCRESNSRLASWRKGVGNRKLMSLHGTMPTKEQTVLMVENLTSDAPRIRCDQYLLRILTERGGGTVPTLSKWEVTLNLCLPCPDHTTLSLGRVRCLCGGWSSSTSTQASNILH